MFLGRYQLGQEVEFRLQVHNLAFTPAHPEVAAFARVYGPGGTFLFEKQIPSQDVGNVTGLFMYRQFIDSQFSAGKYWVRYHFDLSGAFDAVALDCFDIIPGGDANGQIIAAFWSHLPIVRTIMWQTDSGDIFKAANPEETT